MSPNMYFKSVSMEGSRRVPATQSLQGATMLDEFRNASSRDLVASAALKLFLIKRYSKQNKG